MIKIFDSALVKPLLLIFQNCLDCSTFPDIWKNSNICLVHKKKIKNNLLTITDLFHYCLYLGKYLNNLFLNLFWVSWWTKSAPRTLIRFQNKWFMYKSTTAYCTWLLYGFLCWSYSWSSRCVSKYVKTSDNV